MRVSKRNARMVSTCGNNAHLWLVYTKVPEALTRSAWVAWGKKATLLLGIATSGAWKWRALIASGQQGTRQQGILLPFAIPCPKGSARDVRKRVAKTSRERYARTVLSERRRMQMRIVARIHDEYVTIGRHGNSGKIMERQTKKYMVMLQNYLHRNDLQCSKWTYTDIGEKASL